MAIEPRSTIFMTAGGYVYVILETRTGLYKIGITSNLSRRMKELQVGTTAKLIDYALYRDPKLIEQALHRQYRHKRIPQTEYFCLDEPPVLIREETHNPRETLSNYHNTAIIHNTRKAELRANQPQPKKPKWDFWSVIAIGILPWLFCFVTQPALTIAFTCIAAVIHLSRRHK